MVIIVALVIMAVVIDADNGGDDDSDGKQVCVLGKTNLVFSREIISSLTKVAQILVIF